MILSRHADHVDADDAHDGDLELLIGDDVEQQQLELHLKPAARASLVSAARNARCTGPARNGPTT